MTKYELYISMVSQMLAGKLLGGPVAYCGSEATFTQICGTPQMAYGFNPITVIFLVMFCTYWSTARVVSSAVQPNNSAISGPTTGAA